MKPWEEEWAPYVVPEEHDDAGSVYVTDAHELVVANIVEPLIESLAERERYASERAALVSAAPDMARVLLEIEWTNNDDRSMCPSCGGIDPSDPMNYGPEDIGHRPNCALDAALRKAGVRR